MSDSVQPHRQQPTRLPRPWDSPGKNTGVGCHFLLQCRKVKSESEVTQSCPTLATPWTTAHQAPPSMGFSRQKYWSGVPLPSPSSGVEDDVSCPLLQNSTSLPADTGFCACLPSFPEGKFYAFLIFDTPTSFSKVFYALVYAQKNP